MSSERQGVEVKSGQGYPKYTVDHNGRTTLANQNIPDIQTLERSLIGTFTSEMGNIVDTVEDRIPNFIMAIRNNICDQD